MDVGGPDLATLGLGINASGMATGASAAKSELASLSAAAEATSQKIAAVGTAGATKFSQAFAESSARSTQILEQQLGALSQITAGWGSASAQARDIGIKLAAAIESEGRMAGATAAQVLALAEAQAAMTASAEGSIYATHSMIAAQGEAIAMNEKLGQSQQLHGLQLGRLNQELGTFIGRLTGTNTAVTRLSAQIGGAVLGYGSMIAILGGVALAVAAAEAVYHRFTDATTKAREENEKLLKTLDDIAKRRGETQFTTTESAIAAGTAKLADLNNQLAIAQAALVRPVTAYAGGGLAPGTDNAKALKDVQDLTAKIRSAEAEQTALVRAASEDRDRILTSDLASLIKNGDATAAQITAGKALLTGYVQSLDALQKAGSADTATLVDLSTKIKALNDALYPKQRVGGFEQIPTDAIVLGLQKQLDEIRKVNQESNIAAQKARDFAAAVGLEGEVLKLYENAQSAATERLKAFNEYSGIALTERLASIDATEKQNAASIRHALALEDETQRLKTMSDLQKKANEIAKDNAKQTADGLNEGLKLYRASEDEARKLAGTLEGDLLRTIISVASTGVTSFEAFFRTIERGGERMAEALARSLAQQSALWKKAIEQGQTADAAIIAERVKRLQTIASIGAGGLAGAGAGYNAGLANPGSAAGAALSGSFQGAVAGAITGASVAGPYGAAIGTVVGETAGLIGGLLGHAKAAKEAAEAEREVREAYTQSLSSYKLALGVISPIQDALTKNQQTAQQLRDEIEKGYAGTKNQTEREQKLAEANRLEAIGATKIASDFWAGITIALNALHGPQGALENQLIALKKGYDANVQSALTLGGSTDQITKLYEEQVAAAKAAYAEGQKQLQASLDARELYAKGLTAEGDALARTAAEERELFEATVAGYTDAQLAQLKYIQGLEDAAAAMKKATEAQRALEDVQSATAHLTATSQAQRNALDTADLLAKQQRELDDLKAAGASAELLAATVAKDAAEQAALAWQQALATIAQANTDIQRDVSLGFTSPTTAFAQEAANYGFGGQTIEQIKAQYTPFAGTPLTDAQEQMNKYIEQLVNDFNRWFPASGASPLAGAVGRQAGGQREAITNAATALSEATGNRMADYLASILIVEREQLTFWKSTFGGSFADRVSGASGGSTGPSSGLSALSVPLLNFAPAPTPSVDTSALSAWSGRTPAAPVSTNPEAARPVIQIVVNVTAPATGTDAAGFADDLAGEIARRVAPLVNQEFAQAALVANLRDGNPIKIGA